MVLQNAEMLLMVCLFQLCIHNPHMYTQFGFATMPIYIGFTIFQMIFGVVAPFLNFGKNCMLRTFEYQADRFAVKVSDGEKLQSGLIKMHTENNITMIVDKLYSAY